MDVSPEGERRRRYESLIENITSGRTTLSSYPWRRLVIDEAHTVFGNEKRFRDFMDLSFENVWLMTATPKSTPQWWGTFLSTMLGISCVNVVEA
jgi:hypothetical protein